nr:hypothetical protein [Devosia aurantiaca]
MRIVHAGQIVEDQRRGVHHFDGASGIENSSLLPGLRLSDQIKKNRPDPLAFAEECVADGANKIGRDTRQIGNKGLETMFHGAAHGQRIGDRSNAGRFQIE